jgi:hypothetical protein
VIVCGRQVTRRILRHHKKIFKDDIERLCKFIIASCEAISCLLSHHFRREKNKIDHEAKQHALGSSSESREEEMRKKSAGAVDTRSVEHLAPLPLNLAA